MIVASLQEAEKVLEKRWKALPKDAKWGISKRYKILDALYHTYDEYDEYANYPVKETRAAIEQMCKTHNC